MLKKIVSLVIAFGIIFMNVKPVLSYTDDEVSQQDDSYQYHIFGYAFIDSNHSGMIEDEDAKVADFDIKLWQGNNLLMVSQTDDYGYYEFYLPQSSDTYRLTIENLNDYSLMSYDESHEANSFVLEDDKQSYCDVIVNTSLSSKCNIGFNEVEYKLLYDISDANGQLDFYQTTYHVRDCIILANHDSLYKDGYVFAGWNTMANGNGEHYQSSDTFLMPKHSVTLYAIWKKVNADPIEKSSQAKYLEDGSQVVTSDDSHILLLSLLLLMSLGGIIVVKALKKRKNR